MYLLLVISLAPGGEGAPQCQAEARKREGLPPLEEAVSALPGEQVAALMKQWRPRGVPHEDAPC